MAVENVSQRRPEVQIREFFTREGSKDVKSTTLEPANLAISGNSEFESFVQEKLKSKLSDVPLPSTKQELEARLMQLGVKDIKETAENGLQLASNDREKWAELRHKGPGRFVQSFLTSFSSYLEAYSGIVEVVKNGGQPYGQVAYSTLSIFLIVAVNKSENDTKIAEMLMDLENSFPRMEILLKVYATPKFAKLVAEVYKEGVLFAREATRYFCSRSERLKWAMGKPPQMGVDLSVQRIHKRLAEVNSEAMALLHSAAHRIEEQLRMDMREIAQKYEDLKKQNEGLAKQNEDLKRQNNDIQAKLEVMHEEEQSRASDEIRKRQQMLKHYLGLTEKGIHTDIDQYQGALSRAFANDMINPSLLPRRHLQMTPELLSTETAYDKWKTTSKSCVLLLCGTTPPEVLMNRSTHSWLSAGAVFVAKSLLIDGQTVAFYSCHPEDHSEEVGIKDIIANLIAQILSHHPDSLKSTSSDFELLLTKMKTEERIATAVQPLKEVLRSQEKNSVIHIVLDRFDRCNNEKRIEIIRALLEAMEEAVCVVKILITIDPMFWPLEDWKYDKRKLLDMQDESNGCMLSRMDWDQPRDPSKW